MSATPPQLKWVCRPVGADNSTIYREFLGYDEEKLTQLREQGVV